MTPTVLKPVGSSTPPSGSPEEPSTSTHFQYLWYGVAVVLLVAISGAVYWFWAGGEVEEPVAAAEPFILGGILPLSGDAASFGIPIKQAAELAIEEINNAGGIKGRQVVLRFEDGKCESEDSRAAAERLLATNEIDLMIAGGCSSEFLAAAPLVQDRGIISLSSSATNPDISKLGKLVFRTAPSDALAGKVAAEYAFKNMTASSAAIITEDKAYTQALREVFKKEFGELGGVVVADEVYQTGATDFVTIAESVMAANPSVVYVLPQSPTPGILAVKELKALNPDVKVLTAEVLLIRDAISEQGDILEGVTGIEVLFDEQNPKAAQFLKRFEEEYALEATYPGFMAGMYDLMYLVKEAAEATDGSSAAIADYLYAVNDWNGAVGPLSFDGNGDALLPYSIRKVSNREAPVIDVYSITE